MVNNTLPPEIGDALKKNWRQTPAGEWVRKAASLIGISGSSIEPITFGANFEIAKIEDDQQRVFGFFSIVEVNGELVLDKQDDVILPTDLEEAGYGFVLKARIAGENHEEMDMGRLIESFIITKEKQEAMVAALKQMGIEAAMDLKIAGWWGGFQITDKPLWKRIKAGERPMFSIGGQATREKIPPA